MPEASKPQNVPNPEVVKAAVQGEGGCGEVSPDGLRACVKDIGHGGPHGWESNQQSRPMIESDHPEANCQRCGGHNIVWYAPSEAWNEVTAAVDPVKERGVIWCPDCFAELAEQHGWHVTGYAAEVVRR